MRVQLFNPWFEKYRQKSREKKVEEFFRLMDPVKNDTLLDVGGGRGHGFRETWNFSETIIVIDRDKEAMEAVRREMKHAEVIVGNACNLPLSDKSVDYVFSNALIEHIPKERRGLFTSELRRVTKKAILLLLRIITSLTSLIIKCHFGNIYLRELKRD